MTKPRFGSVVLLVLAASGCGNAAVVHDAGQLGITVDAAGRPVIAVMSCAKATVWVNLSEGRQESQPGDQPNVQRASWRSRSSFAGVRTLALTGDGNWSSTGKAGSLQPDQLLVLGGGTAEDDDASLTPVSFRVSDLTGMSPDQVRIEGKTESLAGFGTHRCS